MFSILFNFIFIPFIKILVLTLQVDFATLIIYNLRFLKTTIKSQLREQAGSMGKGLTHDTEEIPWRR